MKCVKCTKKDLLCISLSIIILLLGLFIINKVYDDKNSDCVEQCFELCKDSTICFRECFDGCSDNHKIIGAITTSAVSFS